MKHILKSFLRYHIKGNFQYRLAKRQLDKSAVPIVIYTMAKVGSMSLYQSLKNANIHPVYHIHSLQEKKIQEAYELCRAKGWWPDSKSLGGLIYDKKIKAGKPIKLITAIREPIARNISAFFEVFRFYNQSDARFYTGEISDLQSTFIHCLPHEYPLTWFDVELKYATQIDVYATAFDKYKKWQIYKFKNVELLLLRTDLSNQIKVSIIKDFLKIKTFELRNYNVGNKKDYAALYKSFKKNIVLSEPYVKQMLDSKYCKHFYSKIERNDLYTHWIEGKQS